MRHAFNPSLVRLAPLLLLRPILYRLSIPAWFDWRYEPGMAIAPFIDLSIPAWFDWRPEIWTHHHHRIHPFQSQLGSIGAPTWTFHNSTCHAFNPSLVRLALTSQPPQRGQLTTFNPSLVRLAPPLPGPPAHEGGAFQSQLGSIGAGVVETDGCPHIDFQSQLGSIGALLLRGVAKKGGGTFNPSLVRLAPPAEELTRLGIDAFNPSLVRLAPRGWRRWGSCARHLSIPAWFDWRRCWSGRCGRPTCPFQSQLGSIGATGV